MWLELGCRTAPLFLEGRQRPDPIGLECHGKGRGALKQEPEALPPSSPPESPSEGSCPCVLGEEVSRETTGPHLQGTDGKGSQTGVRSGWDRRVQTTEFQCWGGEGWRTRPRRRRGLRGGEAVRGLTEGPLNPDVQPPRPQTAAGRLEDWRPDWPLTTALGKMSLCGQGAHGVS